MDWVRRFIRHFGKRHPRELGTAEVERFLTYLAVEGCVSASAQNQAKSALLFLYRDVLRVDLDWLGSVTQARVPQRLPVVLTPSEVRRLLDRLSGTRLLMARLLYGAGLRLMECVRLRVKDIDFERGEIIVRDGKGQKDRVTMLPAACESSLKEHVRSVRVLHREDLDLGNGANNTISVGINDTMFEDNGGGPWNITLKVFRNPSVVADGGFERQATSMISSPWRGEGPDFKGIDIARNLAFSGRNNA